MSGAVYALADATRGHWFSMIGCIWTRKNASTATSALDRVPLQVMVIGSSSSEHDYKNRGFGIFTGLIPGIHVNNTALTFKYSEGRFCGYCGECVFSFSILDLLLQLGWSDRDYM